MQIYFFFFAGYGMEGKTKLKTIFFLRLKVVGLMVISKAWMHDIF